MMIYCTVIGGLLGFYSSILLRSIPRLWHLIQEFNKTLKFSKEV